ncbi:hypothetical protein [Spirochaeta isovalerica]|uniref:PsbP C-terminal domain-containing protein n=1 Tax=Spirochaeta isovalerica TaxID=150 RepID=A0A841R8Q1_9SPIO|nr:hypothetical protein [Spirochaeta isovalerica]MBB6480273.1 hypothetical protein [Spirochaeta isovalerica]
MKKIVLAAFLIVSMNVILASQDKMTASYGNIKIDIPLGWMVQYTQSPSVFFIFSPLEPNDTFQENANLVIEALPYKISLSDYISLSQEGLKSVYGKFEMLETAENYHIIRGYIGSTQVQQLQIFYVTDNNAYILTFSSNPDNFARFRDQFFTLAGTFRY